MSIWDKYPNFAEDELRTLVVVTAEVLLESEEGSRQFPRDFLAVSTLAASRDLLPILQAENPGITREQVQDLLEDEELSTQVALRVLEEIRQYPDLAERIGKAYDLRTQKMGGPELVLLVGALVILAVKVKEIDWSKGHKKISFYKAGIEIQSFLTDLLTKFGGI